MEEDEILKYSMQITKSDTILRKVITEANPDVVIHCAAWTAVDLAEDDDKKEKVHQMNNSSSWRIH